MGYPRLDRLVEPIWNKQPDEQAKYHSRFLLYLEQTPGNRSMGAVAERLGMTRAAVEQQASAHRWSERAAAHDKHESQRRMDNLSEETERLAMKKIDAAHMVLEAVKRSVQYILDNDIMLTPADVSKWIDAVVKLSKDVQSLPDQRIEVTGAGGGPIQVDIPELDGLPEQEQRARVTDMLASVTRLYETTGDDAGEAVA